MHRGLTDQRDLLHSICRCCDSSDSCSVVPQLHQQLTRIPRGGATTTVSAATPLHWPLHVWKIIFQLCLTAINVFFWLVPLKTRKITDNKLTLSLANAFSGGVFLSLAFGHLIPECVAGFQHYLAQLAAEPTPTIARNILHNEALPYMLVLIGYLLIFFVEKVAFDAHGALHQLEYAQNTHNHPTTETKAPHTSQRPNSTPALVAESSSTLSSSASSSLTTETGSTAPVGRSALILLTALAVHSILEMTALGLADSFADCSLLSLSIALHQPAESIALLVAFVKSGIPHKDIIKYLSIFSAMGPIGVAIGMAVNEFASPVVDCIMLAIVAGTFVYVGATEVIPEEWEHSDNKWTKFVALMTGIISIFAITQYTMSLDAMS
jgi:zinc transporter 1/2/3